MLTAVLPRLTALWLLHYVLLSGMPKASLRTGWKYKRFSKCMISI
jgi:hypothetical protein